MNHRRPRDWQEPEGDGPRQQRPLLCLAKQQQDETHQRIERDNVAEPQQQQVGKADPEKDDQATNIAGHPLSPSLEPAKLDSEADSEQQREDGVKFAGEQPLHRHFGEIVERRTDCRGPASLVIHPEANESGHVDDENAEQSEAAKTVEKVRTSLRIDRRHAARSHCHSPFARHRNMS